MRKIYGNTLTNESAEMDACLFRSIRHMNAGSEPTGIYLRRILSGVYAPAVSAANTERSA